MKKSLIQRWIQNIREITPLSLRKMGGPVFAYISYVIRVYIKKNYQSPKVLSIDDTLEMLIKEKLSVVRFGDGEISLIHGISLGFQEKNVQLADALRRIIQTDEKGLLICVSGFWGKLDSFTRKAFLFNLHHLFKYEHVWRSLLSYEQVYGDAFLTRPYLFFKNKSNAGLLFSKLFSVWNDQDVLLIEGDKSRIGVGNDMFQRTRSLQRIVCPSVNAYAKYQEIKDEVLKIPKANLILVSLGPTAKVLAYDLFLLGYRVIDIGHIDMEYEMFLRKETVLTKVKYKYFNEIDERNPEDCNDKKYLSQIISRVL